MRIFVGFVPDDIKVKNETEDYTIHVKRKTLKTWTDEPDISIKRMKEAKEECIYPKDLIPRNLGKADITVYY